MIGKASEIRVYETPARDLQEWLIKKWDIQVIDIKYTVSDTGLSYALIIYKEE